MLRCPIRGFAGVVLEVVEPVLFVGGVLQEFPIAVADAVVGRAVIQSPAFEPDPEQVAVFGRLGLAQQRRQDAAASCRRCWASPNRPKTATCSGSGSKAGDCITARPTTASATAIGNS